MLLNSSFQHKDFQRPQKQTKWYKTRVGMEDSHWPVWKNWYPTLLIQRDSVKSTQTNSEPGFEYWGSLRFTLIWQTGLARVNWLTNCTHDFSKYLHVFYANILNLKKLYHHDFQVQIYIVSLNSALIVLKTKQNKNTKKNTTFNCSPQTLACTNSLKIDKYHSGSSQEMNYLIKWNMA